MPGQPGAPGQPGQGAAGGAASQGTLNSGDPNGGMSADATGQMMKDKLFLRKAAEGGMAEVQLGQLAASNGGSQAVKDFGQRMVDDHTRLDNTMAPIAQQMGVAAPKDLPKKDKEEMAKLQGMKGTQFDKEYMNFMVKGHRNDDRDFKMEMAMTNDPALKSAVTGAQKVVHQHLLLAEQIQKAQKTEASDHAGGVTTK